MDRDLAGRELDRLPRACELVRAPTGDLDRAVVGRDLADRAGERGQRGGQRVAGDRRPLDRRPLAVDVVGRRPLAEAHRGPVALGRREVVLDEAGRPAEEHGQHARRRTGRASRHGRRVGSTTGAGPGRRRRARSAPTASATIEDAIEPARPSRRGSPPDGRGEAPGLGAGRRRPPRSSGRPIVAPAARAWPPPPNVPVSTVASTPPGLVRTLRRVVPSSWALSSIATSAVSDWARRSMMPSECAGRAPVASRSPGTRVDQMTRPSGDAWRRSRTRPNSRSWASGLVRYRRREMSDRGAPAATSAAGDREGPRRRVGVREGRRVHHDTGHQRGRERPVAGVERNAQPHREQRDHLARRGGARVDPVPRSRPRRSTRDGRSRPAAGRGTGPAWRSATAPTRSAGRTVREHQQVVRDRRVGIRPHALHVGHEVVQRWRRVGEHGRGAAARSPRPGGTRPASRRGCRRPGSRGPRRAPRARPAGARAPRRERRRWRGPRDRSRSSSAARLGLARPRLAARGRAAAALRGASARPGLTTRRGARAAAWAPGPSPARRAGSSVSPSWGSRLTGLGSDSSNGVIAWGSMPASSSLSRWSSRVPRSAESSSRTCSSGIRRIRRRRPSSWRM